MSEGIRQMWSVLFRKKTVMNPGVWHTHLKGLSVVDVTCLGLATTLGTGIYTLTAVAAHDHAGPSVVLAILMAAVTSCLGGLCYSELVARFPKGGSAYSYVYATTGEFCAFLVGWGMVLEYALGAALAAKACTQHVDVLVDGAMSRALTDHIGRLEVRGLDHFLDFPAVAVLLVACLTIVASVKVLCSINNVFIVVNLLVISGTVAVGIFDMDSENWIAGPGFFPGGINGIFSAASLCYFAFVGYDVLAIATRGSPHRSHTFPALVSTVFAAGLLAAFAVAVVLTLLVPFATLETRAPLLQALQLRGAAGARYLAAVGALAGLAAAAATALLALAKLVQSLAADGLLFRFLCRTQCHSLVSATILSSSLALLSDSLTLVHALGMGTLVSCISAAVCVLRIRYGTDSPSPEPADEATATAAAEPPPAGYGTLSVDLVDEASYVTCLSELSPHWTREEPSHRSAATVAGLVAAAVALMLLMGVVTLHVPRLLPSGRLWTELAAAVLFLAVLGFAAAICRQRRRRPGGRNKVPCVPCLPLCAIWMDVHLVVGLPYTAWILFFVWSLIGALVYLSYGIWNSSERRFHDPQNVNLLTVNEECSDSEKDNAQQNDAQAE